MKAGSKVHLSCSDLALVSQISQRGRTASLYRFLLPLGPGLPTIASASIWVVVLVDGAPALLLDVLRLRTVVLATLLRLLGENGDVVPRRWVPVGIIVPLLLRLNYNATAVKHLTTQNSGNAPTGPTEFSSV